MMQSSLSRQLSDLEKHVDELSEGSNGDDEDAVRLQFLKIWEKIPGAWRAQCIPPLDLVKANRPKEDRVRVDKWSVDPIKVPDIVLTQLDIWENDPSSILTSEVTLSTDSSQAFPDRLYLALDHKLNKSRIVTAITTRMLQIAFHFLMKRLDVSQLHPNSDADSEFFDRLNVRSNDEGTKKNCRTWATTGRKYDSLSAEFEGLGSMICMPDDISTYKLERIPPGGTVRRNAVECLKARGINDKTDAGIQRCYTVAEKIWRWMIAEMDEYFIQYALPPQKQKAITLPQCSKKRRRKPHEGKIRSRQKKQARQTSGEYLPKIFTVPAGLNTNITQDLLDRQGTDRLPAFPNLAQNPEQPSGNPDLNVNTTCPQPLCTALVSLRVGAPGSPQHESDKPPSPSQDLEGTMPSRRPEATVTYNLETGNSEINTGGPVLPPAPFGSPPATQLNPNLTPRQQVGLWNDMTIVNSHFWDDMADVSSQFWNDMNVVDWDEFTNDTSDVGGNVPPSGAPDPHLLNPNSMDSSFPVPNNSSEVLSST